jgi:hypothetical protein
MGNIRDSGVSGSDAISHVRSGIMHHREQEV